MSLRNLIALSFVALTFGACGEKKTPTVGEAKGFATVATKQTTVSGLR